MKPFPETVCGRCSGRVMITDERREGEEQSEQKITAIISPVRRVSSVEILCLEEQNKFSPLFVQEVFKSSMTTSEFAATGIAEYAPADAKTNLSPRFLIPGDTSVCVPRQRGGHLYGKNGRLLRQRSRANMRLRRAALPRACLSPPAPQSELPSLPRHGYKTRPSPTVPRNNDTTTTPNTVTDIVSTHRCYSQTDVDVDLTKSSQCNRHSLSNTKHNVKKTHHVSPIHH
ncbi:hypothetical protein J6590_003452 [Homalodisca vitripennis]|nr:hypothetical protein J6590_003452 [Homalodisca vitripennis]